MQHKNIYEPAIQLNVALIPEEKILQQAIELSQKLQKHLDTQFILDVKTFTPHITIAQARYPKHNLEKVISYIKKETRALLSSPLRFSNFDLVLNQFIFWNIVRTQQLLDLHQKIVNSTNPLREGEIIAHIASMKNLSQEDEQDRKTYGALLIGGRYQPHITLTRLKKDAILPEVTKIIGKQKTETSTLTKSKLVIGYLGDHGTVNGIIEEIPLGK